MRDQTSRKNNELEQKSARKKTPPAVKRDYNLHDNIIGKSLENGLDRIAKVSNATSEYGGSVSNSKRYASADALNSTSGELTPMLSRQPKFYATAQHSRTNSLQQHGIEVIKIEI